MTATAIFAGVGVYEHLGGNNVSAFWFACLTVPLFWVGAYAAWFKKHEAILKLEAGRDMPECQLAWSASTKKMDVPRSLVDGWENR